MGIDVRALTKVKRGTYDLVAGRQYFLDDKEAETLIRNGQAERVVIDRNIPTETAEAKPTATKAARQPRGNRRSSS